MIIIVSQAGFYYNLLTMKTLGFYNGEIGEIDDMRIPMNDRSSWFGDGVYDAAVAVNGIIFALDEHIDRFFRSASFLEMTVPKSKDELAELLAAFVKRVEGKAHFVYWQITRGTADRSHVFPENAVANLWVTVKPLVMPDLYAKVKLITLEDTRFLHCNIKTLNLIPNVMASEKAKRAGAKEAVLHRGERVTECAHSNVHIFRDGVLRTAPADNLILPGISRAHIIRRCAALGIPVEERAFTLAELMAADEVMISSCSSLCIAADYIDGVPVGHRAPALLGKLQDSLWEEFCEVTGSRRQAAGRAD